MAVEIVLPQELNTPIPNFCITFAMNCQPLQFQWNLYTDENLSITIF